MNMNDSIEARKKLVDQIKLKYPDMIPIIVQVKENSKLPQLEKNKFLIPNDYLAYQFVQVIRQRLRVPKTSSIFLFINDKTILKTDSFMVDIYNFLLYFTKKSADGFLYITIDNEVTMG